MSDQEIAEIEREVMIDQEVTAWVNAFALGMTVLVREAGYATFTDREILHLATPGEGTPYRVTLEITLEEEEDREIATDND